MYGADSQERIYSSTKPCKVIKPKQNPRPAPALQVLSCYATLPPPSSPEKEGNKPLNKARKSCRYAKKHSWTRRKTETSGGASTRSVGVGQGFQSLTNSYIVNLTSNHKSAGLGLKIWQNFQVLFTFSILSVGCIVEEFHLLLRQFVGMHLELMAHQIKRVNYLALKTEQVQKHKPTNEQ